MSPSCWQRQGRSASFTSLWHFTALTWCPDLVTTSRRSDLKVLGRKLMYHERKGRSPSRNPSHTAHWWRNFCRRTSTDAPSHPKMRLFIQHQTTHNLKGRYPCGKALIPKIWAYRPTITANQSQEGSALPANDVEGRFGFSYPSRLTRNH